jgi:hypothetical protein
MEASWWLQPSPGDGLFEANIPSEKMRLIAACEVRNVRKQMCPDFTHKFLGPPHGLGCFPLAPAGNPVVSLVPNAQELRQGPAQSLWVLLAAMDQLADEARLQKVISPRSSGPLGEISSLSKAAMASWKQA